MPPSDKPNGTSGTSKYGTRARNRDNPYTLLTPDQMGGLVVGNKQSQAGPVGRTAPVYTDPDQEKPSNQEYDAMGINPARGSQYMVEHYADDKARYEQMAQDALERRYTDDQGMQQARDAQTGFRGDMFQAMVGNTPSAANIRGNAEQDRAVTQGMGAMSSGMPAAQAVRAGLGAAGQAGIAANAQASALRMQEQAQNQNAYQQYLQGIQKSDIGSALEQQRLNSQLSTTYAGMGSDMLSQQAQYNAAYDKIMNEQYMRNRLVDQGSYEQAAGNYFGLSDILGPVLNSGASAAANYFGRKSNEQEQYGNKLPGGKD